MTNALAYYKKCSVAQENFTTQDPFIEIVWTRWAMPRNDKFIKDLKKFYFQKIILLKELSQTRNCDHCASISIMCRKLQVKIR